MNITEFSLIERIKHRSGSIPDGVAGIGDDCAVIPRNDTECTLLSVDTLVENVHFSCDTMSYEQIGRKAAAVNLSDIAAMGGVPEYILVSLALSETMTSEQVLALYEGMRSVNDIWNIPIIGGDTVASEVLSLSVTIVGKADPKKVVYRSGAKDGDLICVTGSLGGSICQKHYDFRPRIDEAQWLLSHVAPTAMMDISDGLAGDLRHILKASGDLGAVLYEANLPISKDCPEPYVEHALSDGEDFELLFTIDSQDQSLLKAASFDVTEIGVIDSERDGIVLKNEHSTRSCVEKAYDHFLKD